MKVLIFATVFQAICASIGGRLTPLHLTRCYLTRIDQMDPFLNAVIETNPEAEDTAKELSSVEIDFNKFPLWGIPILLKDNIGTSDRMNTTAGSFALLGATPKLNAPVVKKLRKAGAIILGKSKLSDLTGYRSFSVPEGWSSRGGQTRNPYHLNKTTRGSSSGSAMGVAANLAMASLATETVGSLVSPSSVGMVVGFKPSFGLVSNIGTVPVAPTFDTVGVIRDPYLNETSTEIISQFDSMVQRIRRARFLVKDDLSLNTDFLNYGDILAVFDIEIKHSMKEYLTDHTESGDYPKLPGIELGYTQDLLENAESLDFDLASQEYLDARSRVSDSMSNTIQEFMKRHGINVIMVPTDNDMYPFAPASLGGMPMINIPAGVSIGLRLENNQIPNVTTSNLGSTCTKGPTHPENQRRASAQIASQIQ